jgi:hypothetical protein
MTVALDRRSHDLVSIPRSGLSESWMDVRASALEARRELGKALVDHRRGQSPMPGVFRADRRLIRLEQYARQRAAEAEGITFLEPLDPNQLELPLGDGCFGPDGRAG